jgi:hypothetical protein
MAPSFLPFFDPSKIEHTTAFLLRSTAGTMLGTVYYCTCARYSSLCTLTLTLMISYLAPPWHQVGGLESKALPVTNYCYIRTSRHSTSGESHIWRQHTAEKIGIWAQKVEKVNFHLVKMALKGIIEKNEKVLNTPLSTHISLKIGTLSLIKLFILFQNAYFNFFIF